VVLTSNRTREVHDAVKRRCLYHWVGFPDSVRELEIIRRRVPGASERLAREIVAFVQRLRKEDLGKTPGVAETLDWVRALHRLNWRELADDPAAIVATLGCLLKTREDRFQMGPERVLQLVEGRRSVGVAEKVAA